MENTKPIASDQAISFIWDAMDKGLLRHWEGALDSKSAALYMQKLAERTISNAKKHQPRIKR